MIVAPLCLSCVSNSTHIKPVKKYQTGPQFLRDELLELVVSNESQESQENRSSGRKPPSVEDGPMQTMPVVINVTVNTSPNASSKTIITKKMLLRLSACLYNKVTFSSDNKYFIRECLGPGVPTVTLHSAPLGRLLFVLDNNTALKQEVADLGLPVIRTFFVEVSDGYRAPVKLYLPPVSSFPPVSLVI